MPGIWKTSLSALMVGVVCAAAASAQRYKLVYNPESPEGQFLQLIEDELDATSRIPLLERFVERYPKAPAAPWACDQLQVFYFQKNDFDKALSYGEKLVKLVPDDLEAAQLNLRAAESKKDPALIKLWEGYCIQAAQRVIESPAPKDPEALEEWIRRTAIADQFAQRGEYEIFKRALDAQDLTAKLRGLDELVKLNPNTPYMPQILAIYLQTYRKLRDSRKMAEVAERLVKFDPNNEDALVVLAEDALNRTGQPERVLSYSAKIIELMRTKSKPAEVRDLDWEKKKSFYTGTAHWMMGNVYVNQKRFGSADQALRAALPYFSSADESQSAILFYLGWSNENLEKYADATAYYKRCLAIPSRFQDPARRNLEVLGKQQRP